MPLPRSIRRAVVVPVLFAALASTAALWVPSFAQDTSPVRQGEIAGVKQEILVWIKEGEGKLIELAKAVREAKYLTPPWTARDEAEAKKASESKGEPKP